MSRHSPVGDLTNQSFDDWTVVGRGPDYIRSNGYSAYKRWLCRCVCGKESLIGEMNLLSKASGGCGCRKSAKVSKAKTKHGGYGTKLYSIWFGMLDRCFNKNHVGYHNYGGRGITVCDRWRRSFSAFREDMGERPSEHHSIDRFPDNNGNYEPGNCRWATDIEQGRNRRNNVVWTHNGITQTVSAWARTLGCSPSTLMYRRSRGLTVKEILEKPFAPIRRGTK